MSTVHFENGEYHLHVELILEASQQKENPKENIPASVYETLANHTLSESKFNLPDCVISDLKFPPFQQHLSDVCLPITSPPPEA